ncbi:MAG: hypothetical protein NUV55_07835 [Sulfuricaulis sp.]|uniref:hypothetical protein n=1 Tax=Sulfuricaulis sp. TaxID=2003553 RepID=UPI0025E0D85D|nr:hypothetical protein [Sulfuricaulis sp.]MCR4347094.1 hypothetical protein [Sulfuricaulis sp.]
MGLINSIHNKIPDGIYRTYIKNLVSWLQVFSLNYHFKRYVRKTLNPDSDINKIKTAPWASELYQICAVLFALVLLIFVAPNLPIVSIWAVAILVFISLYRPLEITIFLVNWIFTITDEVHSYKRSLAGFLINLLELVLFFSIAQLVIGCYKTNSILDAIYSNARTVVTIGPIGSYNYHSCIYCDIILLAQIGVTSFLLIIVIASAVGVIKVPPEAGSKNGNNTSNKPIQPTPKSGASDG